MYYFVIDNILIIPMAFNMFLFELSRTKSEVLYSQYDVQLKAEFLDLLISDIAHRRNIDLIALDMKGVTSPPRMLTKFHEINNDKVIFYNIQGDLLEKVFDEDLKTCIKHHNEKFLCYCFDDNKTSYIDTHASKLIDIYSIKLVEIIESIFDEEITKLDSSGMYSNRYLNVKHLFENKESYLYIVYMLADLIAKCSTEFDAFICSSKNGAAIANIMGSLFNKNVIHISGVGPKYSMIVGYHGKNIKKNGRYLYIYDFICTGSETKILTSLVNSYEAKIVLGVGIANYKNMSNENGCVKKMIALVNLLDEKIDYHLAGSEEDLKKILGDKKYENP